ncbi:MAG: hypothetical protein ACYDAJ_03030 [Nitrosotalea sp.]
MRDSMVPQNQFVTSGGSEVRGNVVIGKNTTITRYSFVTGPAIGDNCITWPAGLYQRLVDNIF